MLKKPSIRKKPVRHFDPRRIHKGRSYTAKDLSEIYNIDESSVHRWSRQEGLIGIDGKTPAMFHFETTKQFLTHKNNSRKMQVGNAGNLPCLKCFLRRRAYKDKVVLKKTNNQSWNIQALCSCCGTKMNMHTPANEFTLLITWGYEIVETLPQFSIKDTITTHARTTERKDRSKSQFTPQGEIKFHPENERIKHKYFDRVIHRFGKDKKTLKKIISAIFVFEEFSNFSDFKLFTYENSKEFQKYLLKKYCSSMQMANRTMVYVREFFLWLKDQDGYKKIKYDDIQALQLSLKDREKAKTSKPKAYLDAEKWQNLILNLKPENDIELRGRAMLACLLLTGARVEALISFRIGDFNLEHNYVFQDARHVNTKFSSSHKTNLWKFKPEISQILQDWIKTLRAEHGFNDDDPLFPKIHITTNDSFQFEQDGFIKEPIKSTTIVRKELAKQLQSANLGHYTPHTIRNSLIALFMGFDLTPEQLKAVSQNMSHKNLETTVNSYYAVHEYRQDKIIEELDIENLTKIQRIKNNPKYQFLLSQMNDESMIDKLFEAASKDC
jgi:integrase/recombinase XerD